MKNIKKIKIINPTIFNNLKTNALSKSAAEQWAEAQIYTFYSAPIVYGHNSSNESVIKFIGNETKTTDIPIVFAIKELCLMNGLIYDGEYIRNLKLEEYAEKVLENENTLTSIGTRLFQYNETIYLFKSISFDYNEKQIFLSNVSIYINAVKIDFAQHI